MYSLITDADRSTLEAAVGSVGIGNRMFHAQVRPAPGEHGLFIVTVPPAFATTVVAALKRIGAWFDRAQPPLRVPRGKPIVSMAGASTIRNYDKVARKDRKIRRAMKAA